MTDRPLLRVRDLEVSYAGAVRALHAVSLTVPQGAVAAVLGSNGAGKSTLLRAVSGTLPLVGGAVTGGEIELDGRPLRGVPPAEIVRAGVVQVPEGRQVFAELTVEENLRAGALAAPRRTHARARERVEELFPILRERASQPAGLLSGGEQQMLAIGRALMSGPRLLLLDEPSLGLAPRVTERIGDVISEIHRQGTTVVLVEQNAALALDLADLAYLLEVGRIELHGPAAELARTDEVRDRYLGVAGGDGRDRGGTSPRGEREARGAREQAARGEAAGTAPEAVVAARRPREGASALSVEGLSVRFGGVAALTDVSFTVRPNSVHALIGPNGAGKSTCVNVLTGVYAASGGSVRYGEHVLSGLRPHQIARLGVSRTFQNLSLSAGATVAENLLLGRHRLTRSGFLTAGLRLPGARREQAAQERRVGEVAALLGLTGDLDRPVGTLPYGARKRVELGRALCAEPTLLLLDEPVAGMTAGESRQMAELIAGVRAELGVTILLIEHDMVFVMGLAEHVTVLDFGRRIAEGAPAEVQRDPEVLRAYLGSPADHPITDDAEAEEAAT